MRPMKGPTLFGTFQNLLENIYPAQLLQNRAPLHLVNLQPPKPRPQTSFHFLQPIPQDRECSVERLHQSIVQQLAVKLKLRKENSPARKFNHLSGGGSRSPSSTSLYQFQSHEQNSLLTPSSCASYSDNIRGRLLFWRAFSSSSWCAMGQGPCAFVRGGSL